MIIIPRRILRGHAGRRHSQATGGTQSVDEANLFQSSVTCIQLSYNSSREDRSKQQLRGVPASSKLLGRRLDSLD